MPKMTLKIPKLAVSMQEGTLVEWFVATGDTVAVGQKLYSIETEKSSFEVESPFAGTITVLGAIGQTMRIGTPIAEIVT
ncbi:biotin/lipoyl-containing protein [Sandaracinobacteroides saxicola]|uniref:Dihydrolipoamide acyltransferase n=1 Tax=Sandaracinobacteroides saxicola TaxID=2759707 RepID=A0A7G5II93_9SPHN|nr:biotin/lipoyl-containing protein [Sandaracinobacteroides saxicola]QMW23085.1 dihydrolipoamide acyltransferase [Sandaracinobacteroides saxicola]